MMSVKDFLAHSAEKMGFVRERYIEHNIPTSYANVGILPFFGDLRSQCILSSLLLHRTWKGKYLIVAGYPGRSGLYSYASEYWGIKDDASVPSLMGKAAGFGNDNEIALFYEQQIKRWFENVFEAATFSKYYKNGLTQEFFNEFKEVSVAMPKIPSATTEVKRQLSNKDSRKIFLQPSKTIRVWHRGREMTVACKKQFWVELSQQLGKHGYTPVLYRDRLDYNISPEMGDNCIYCDDRQISDVMANMRETGCVLDVFNNTSRLAILARCPFVSCTERNRYINLKEYEIDDLCANNLPHKYIFSFPTMIDAGQWTEFAELICKTLDGFVPTLTQELPSGTESIGVVSYDIVRKHKSRRIRSKFIKIAK